MGERPGLIAGQDLRVEMLGSMLGGAGRLWQSRGLCSEKGEARAMAGKKITYHQQVSYCGKARCRRCREGIGHGPYWYSYKMVNGRTVREYVGKDAPPEVLAALAGIEVSQEFDDTLLRFYTLGGFRLEQRGEASPNTTTPADADNASATETTTAPPTNGRTKARKSTPASASSIIQWESVTDAALQHQRVRSLLNCLVSSPGRKLAREQAMFALWSDLDIETAAHRLDRAVHSLRQIFEPGRSRSEASKILLTEHSTLVLADQAEFWVDADAFESLITKARALRESDPGQTEQLLEEAALLYNGDFLPDEDADWVQSRREALRRTWISLLLELADLRIAREAMPGAIDILDRLLTADPANEAAVQRLVALLAQMGRRGEAIQAYQRFVSVLKQDYQISPVPETRTLYENVLRGRSVLMPRVTGHESASGAASASRGVNGSASANSAYSTDSAYSSASMPAVLPSHMHIGRTQQSPLVGRDEEIARLHELLQITQQTRGLKLAGQRKSTLLTPMDLNTPRQQQCVMLMGDVGIGKTRLAEEAAREAKRRNWAVAWCRAYTQESSVPYRLWTETLRKAMSQGLWQRQEVTKHPLLYQPLRALMPELADLLPPSLQKKLPPPPEQEQLRLWESTRTLLSTICEHTNLLIVLDDLQWADSSSCELLTYLVRQMRGQPVMFLCTCRDTELPGGHPLRGLLTDLQREQAVEQIPVRPLSNTEIGQLISHLPEPVVKGVSENASGNPFFAEELARGLTANAIDVTFDPAKPNKLPETIQAVLDLRLARITQACQRLLERGAVLGGSFLFETICGMASSGASADEDQILDLLEEGLQARMITEEGSGERITYHIWHPLLQTYLYERLSAARRASLHRKAAQVLQSYYASSESERAAEIADHLVKGGAAPALTARYAELAADRAYSLSAYPDVEKYYNLALEYMDRLTPTSSQDELLHHAYILERLGECMIVLGKFEEARKLYEQVLEIRSKQEFATDEERQYEAQIEALIWCEISRAWRYLGDSERARGSVNQGEEVLKDAGVVAGAAWARVRYQQGHTLWLEGHLVEALSMGNEALERFEASPNQLQKSNGLLPLTQAQRILNGDPVGFGKVYTLLAGVEIFLGKSTDSLNHLNQALVVFEKNDLKREITIVCSNQADIYLRKSEYDQARDALQRAFDIAERIGDKPSMSVILNNLGILAARLGNLVEAETWYRQSLVVTEQVNDSFYISLFSSYIATSLIEQGKLDETKPMLIQALKISHTKRIAPCTGFALMALGHLRFAHALANKVQNNKMLSNEKEYIKHSSKHLLLRARTTLLHALNFDGLESDIMLNGQLLLAKIALLVGETESAYNLANKVLDEARISELVWIQANAQSLLGQILMAIGQEAASEPYFHQALTTFSNTGMRLEYARTLQAYGTNLLAFSDKPTLRKQAIASLKEARQTFQDCQANLDLQTIENQLATLGTQLDPDATRIRKQERRVH